MWTLLAELNVLLESKARRHGVLCFELDSAQAAIDQDEGFISNFDEKACSDYSSLMRSHAVSY